MRARQPQALSNLLAGLFGGLQRLGTISTDQGGQALGGHGAFMMAGFFASLISLERAVALRRGVWVPLCSGTAGLLALLGLWPWAAWAWVLAALGLLGLYLWAGRYRAVSLPLAVEASGAVALLWAALAFALGEAGQARWAGACSWC